MILKNSEGKILLIRRNPDKYPEIGATWDIVGGRIDPGSTLLDNLRREIKEETNLDLADEPKLVAAQDILRVEGLHVVRLTYTASIEGEPKLDEEEKNEFGGCSVEEIKALDETELDIYFKELVDKSLVA